MYIQVHFRSDFIMEANTMNLKSSLIWVHYCLQEHKQMREQMTKVITGAEKVHSVCFHDKKIVSMIRKHHNHKLQTNPWHSEEEPHNNHKTL